MINLFTLPTSIKQNRILLVLVSVWGGIDPIGIRVTTTTGRTTMAVTILIGTLVTAVSMNYFNFVVVVVVFDFHNNFSDCLICFV